MPRCGTPRARLLFVVLSYFFFVSLPSKNLCRARAWQRIYNQERGIRRALRNCGSRRFSSGVISLAPTLFMNAIAHFNEHDLSLTFFFLRGVISKTF